jgi:hypothetical protein
VCEHANPHATTSTSTPHRFAAEEESARVAQNRGDGYVDRSYNAEVARFSRRRGSRSSTASGGSVDTSGMVRTFSAGAILGLYPGSGKGHAISGYDGTAYTHTAVRHREEGDRLPQYFSAGSK